jgi:hypothetical protein
MPVFGLIDGNSFYCAAERAFAPELRGAPPRGVIPPFLTGPVRRIHAASFSF